MVFTTFGSWVCDLVLLSRKAIDIMNKPYFQVYIKYIFELNVIVYSKNLFSTLVNMSLCPNRQVPIAAGFRDLVKIRNIYTILVLWKARRPTFASAYVRPNIYELLSFWGWGFQNYPLSLQLYFQTFFFLAYMVR